MEQPQNRMSATQWRDDLHFLADEMPKRHANLFYSMTPEQFESAVSRLDQTIPNLTDNKIIAELMKLVAMISAKGRDGHSHLALNNTRFRSCPLQAYIFSDGVFVVDADDPYRDAIGSRVVKIDDNCINKVMDILDPLVPRDNETRVKSIIPTIMLIPEVLEATGIIGDAGKLAFTLENDKGESRVVFPETVELRDYQAWGQRMTATRLPDRPQVLYLSNLAESFWLRFLENSITLYIQYNAVRSITESGETMEQFAKRVEEFVAACPPARVVIDLRHNGGGDNTTYTPLLDLMSQNEAINQRGKLFTIIGRATFSAAGNFVTEMEQKTSTMFVGEPTGSSPNQYGDTVPIVLPNSGLEARVSSIYWQKSHADDERLCHEPDIWAETTSDDFFGDRDPALERILNYQQD